MPEIDVSKGRIPARIKVNDQPQQKPKKQRESFLSKMICVIKEDIRNIVTNKRMVSEETPDGWEEYKRFCELAKKR